MPTVFLCHASEDKPVAESIQLALASAGCDVFYDEQSLPPGGDYQARIHRAIRKCDLFVFLASAASTTPGRFTLTELKFARERWPSPVNRVLPVTLGSLSPRELPGYLQASTVLSVGGNAAAEVRAVVEVMLRRQLLKRVKYLALLALIPAVAAASYVYQLAGPGAIELTPIAVGRWDGDGNASDRIAHNDGELQGEVSFESGVTPDRKAFGFNGTGFVSVPSASALQFGRGDFSVAFWAHVEQQIDNGAALVSKDDYHGGDVFKGWLFNYCLKCGGWGLEVRDSPEVRLQVRTLTITLSKWHHFVGVRGGASVHLYIDGERVASNSASVIADVSNDAELRIGALSNLSPQLLHGRIASVLLFRSALTESQIKRLANPAGIVNLKRPQTE